MKKHYLLLLIVLASNLVGEAQDKVDINLNVKHSVGGSAEFDRSKYIVIHEDLRGNEWESDALQKSFLEDYDVYLGRNNGAIVWEYNNTKEDPAKPGWPDVSYMKERGANTVKDYKNDAFVHQFEDRYTNMMIGGQEHMYPHGQKTSKYGLEYEGQEATAEFFANYLKYFFGTGGESGTPMPKMLEVINEPFVKAGKLGATKEEIAKYHNVVAKRVKEVTPDVLVGGYTAAHPAFEASNFNHWEGNWRMFIDVAGEEMDFFSFHLYDFMQDKTKIEDSKYRAGSNIEAIMDMINHYSVIALGETKPWSLSEYGWLCKECKDGYDEREDWWNIRSFNTMMVQLLERQDQIINAIPFMLIKASWAKGNEEYNDYGPRLMREVGEVDGEKEHDGWIYTKLLQFFQFWANVKGTRIDTKTTDIDLMADAYVDGKKLYLILSNLEETERDVELNFFDPANNPVQEIMVKHHYAVNDLPILDTTYFDTPQEKIKLASQATMILEYSFENELTINEASKETVYFADKYKQAITANTTKSFTFSNVETKEYGEAILRLGLGRDHGKSLKPIIEVNGTQIDTPDDWRGYDQKTRDSFFGVLEIPVPYKLLKNSNTITVKFGDSGGFITSVAMQVFNFSNKIGRSTTTDVSTTIASQPNGLQDINIYPNPATDSFKVLNVNRNNIEYSILAIDGKKVENGILSNKSNTVDISALNEGVYIVKFKVQGQEKTVKIVKQK